MDEIDKRPAVENATGTTPVLNLTPVAPGPAEDLTQQLKTVGARVRMNVSQGYRTAPSESSISFRKAQSTGYIFRSANDAIRDAKAAAMENTLHAESVKKRSRSVEREGTDGSVHDNSHQGEQESFAKPLQTLATRAIKPLRTSSQRALLQTRSMPVGAFSFGQPNQATTPKAEPVEEEEDWSEETAFAPVEQPFQPMDF
ncbi:hypothetical protein CPB83DRAFT_844073 [Crepidotus variabilis]|uniref:Uncharacterized protein n=1 Tax=Crepidotus variabilis TaxID=179855 RepID=A0A9P6EQR1_9AGAR|nr:hypothetical protein CPB83DRAFT_844073 [Crepidotus variabilis]